MQSRFQEKMHLVYHAQNIILTAFYECYHKTDTAILRKSALQISSNLAVAYPEGFQGRYTGLGSMSCAQLNEKH